MDTAQVYGNECGVGEGIRASRVARESLFVSTKSAAKTKDYDAAVAAIDESLAKLRIGYIDLMLIHAPQPWDDFRGDDYAEGNRQAWRALEDSHKAGKVRRPNSAGLTMLGAADPTHGGTGRVSGAGPPPADAPRAGRMPPGWRRRTPVNETPLACGRVGAVGRVRVSRGSRECPVARQPFGHTAGSRGTRRRGSRHPGS
nr:aldo/keto reductase [Streptomyces sp. ICBB 8177]